MKISNQTLQQRLGFGDEDMKSSLHDELLMWCAAHKKEVLAAVGFYDEALESMAPAGSTIDEREWKVRWEVPLSRADGRGFVVGFADLFIKTRILHIVKWQEDLGRDRWGCRQWGPVEESIQQVSGSIYIEAKSKLPTIGELLRQIQLYKHTVGNAEARWLVVAPDIPHAYSEVLKSQGIYTLEIELY